MDFPLEFAGFKFSPQEKSGPTRENSGHKHRPGPARQPGTRFMDVSVTNANLKDAAVQFCCRVASHCSVMVQWSLAK